MIDLDKLDCAVAGLYDGELEMFITTALAAYKDHRIETCYSMLKDAQQVIEAVIHEEKAKSPR